jgi:two-component system chemotaxis response regulator CheB
MATGASDMLLKPTARAFAGEFAETLENRMRYLVEAAQARPELLALPVARPRKTAKPGFFSRPVTCVALGSSTGGLHALTRFFEAFPSELQMPMLITQHLPPDFIAYFARQMQQIAGRDVIPAIEGETLAPGKVYVAPGDRHLTIRRFGDAVRIVLENSKSESGSCPSVDPMLESVAEVFGADAVGIVLSGMGRDGAHGAQLLADCGGEVLAQDSQSSVIWGMPGAVARAGTANLVESPEKLARHVAQRARAFGWR